MFFETTRSILLFLLMGGWCIFALYIVLRGFYALKGIEKSIAEIAETLKVKS